MMRAILIEALQFAENVLTGGWHYTEGTRMFEDATRLKKRISDYLEGKDDAFVRVSRSDVDELLEYFEQREDASNEGDGWRGNKEMHFAQLLREAIGERR